MAEARTPIFFSFLPPEMPALGDDEAGEAARTGGAVGGGEDGGHVGQSAVGDEALGAVENVLVALALGGRLDAGGVGTGFGLGQGHGGEGGTGGQLAEPLFLLLLGTRQQDGGATEVVGVENGGEAATSPGYLLSHDAGGEEVHALSAVLFRHVGISEAGLEGPRYKLLRKMFGLVVLRRDGTYLLLGEFVRHLLDGSLFVAQAVFQQCLFLPVISLQVLLLLL